MLQSRDDSSQHFDTQLLSPFHWAITSGRSSIALGGGGGGGGGSSPPPIQKNATPIIHHETAPPPTTTHTQKVCYREACALLKATIA